MAEPELPALLGQELIAAHIGRLLDRVKRLERQITLQVREEDNEAGEFGLEKAPQSVGNDTHFYWPVQVDAVDESSQLCSGRRLIPEASSLWIEDPDFTTKAITITFPANVPAPSVGDIVLAVFTGVYEDTPFSTSRYGLFSSSGGATRRALLKENGDDTIVCQLLDNAGTEIGTVVVARPPDLQRTRIDGQTVNGVTFTWTGQDALQATDGSDTEDWRVTPDYIEDYDILFISQPPGGTGLPGIVWQDNNVNSRVWAVLPA